MTFFERIADVLVLIVVVAIVIALVTHKETAQIINSLGAAFSKSISAALGK
jgi:uncharacterized membrane protein